MARKLRIQYPGAIYHVMNRGDLPSSDYGKASRREAVFEDDEDRQRFLETLTGAPNRVERGWYLGGEELRQTMMPLAWIAKRLNLGTRGHLVWLLQQRDQDQPAAPSDQCLLKI
jgi:hypothetical protein